MRRDDRRGEAFVRRSFPGALSLVAADTDRNRLFPYCSNRVPIVRLTVSRHGEGKRGTTVVTSRRNGTAEVRERRADRDTGLGEGDGELRTRSKEDLT